jgi:hypothetical protein
MNYSHCEDNRQTAAGITIELHDDKTAGRSAPITKTDFSVDGNTTPLHSIIFFEEKH